MASESKQQEVVTSLARWVVDENGSTLEFMWQISTIVDGSIVEQREEWRETPVVLRKDIENEHVQ